MQYAVLVRSQCVVCSLESGVGTIPFDMCSKHFAVCSVQYLVKLRQFVMGSSDSVHSGTAGQCNTWLLKCVQCGMFSL